MGWALVGNEAWKGYAHTAVCRWDAVLSKCLSEGCGCGPSGRGVLNCIVMPQKLGFGGRLGHSTARGRWGRLGGCCGRHVTGGYAAGEAAAQQAPAARAQRRGDKPAHRAVLLGSCSGWSVCPNQGTCEG